MKTNKDLAHRIVDEMWNQGRLEVIDELFASSYVNHVVGYPAPLEGPEAFRGMVAMYREALPDMRESIEELHESGDRLIMRWNVVATHRGMCMGVPPTGRKITFSGVTIFRIADGQVQEEWCYWDLPAFTKQLGLT